VHAEVEACSSKAVVVAMLVRSQRASVEVKHIFWWLVCEYVVVC
jgi:hypothetical protein